MPQPTAFASARSPSPTSALKRKLSVASVPTSSAPSVRVRAVSVCNILKFCACEQLPHGVRAGVAVKTFFLPDHADCNSLAKQAGTSTNSSCTLQTCADKVVETCSKFERYATARAHRNSENSEILTLPDFEIGRLFETLTLKIGRKQFGENLCFAINWPKTVLKIRENTSPIANPKQFAEFSISNSEQIALEETSESCSMELRCLCELCECAPAC